jgi:branched-chain amino acid transport system substrate-binding protein
MRKFLAWTFLLAFTLAACKAQQGAGGTIQIGYIGPLTGDAAAFGKDTLNGVKLAVDEINAAGGINGMTVELIAEDGRCTPNDAASAAQKLVNVDKVVAIVGGQCSAETMAVAPIAEDGKVIVISPISSSPNVTTAGDYIFRDYPSDALKTKAMAKYFADKGFKKVGIVTTNSEFSVAFRNALKDEITPLMVGFDETVEPDTKDFRAVLTRHKNAQFDIFVPNAHANAPMAALIEQFRELGFKQPMISHDVADTEDTIKAAGSAAEGLNVINVQSLDDSTPFGQKFIPKYGKAQSGLAYAAHSYDATNVIVNAIKAVGADGTKIKDYLYAMQPYSGVVGTFSFDRNGDVVGLSYALKEVKNGKFVKTGDIPLQ